MVWKTKASSSVNGRFGGGLVSVMQTAGVVEAMVDIEIRMAAL